MSVYSCLEIRSKVLLMSSDPRSCTVVHVEGLLRTERLQSWSYVWRAFSHSTSDGISGHLFSYRPSKVQGVALMPSDINMTAITPLPTPLHMYICTYVYYKHNVYIYIIYIYIQARSQDFIWGGGGVVWRGRGIFFFGGGGGSIHGCVS